jgi:choline-sulfatase
MVMRFIGRRPAIILALASFALPAVAAGRRDRNVLLITIDTVRIGCYGYAGAKTPNLDRLAADGVRYADAYAQVPLTLPSHCSIMTGTYPLDHGVRNNGSYSLGPDLPTLAGTLKARGYKTAAFVASFTLDSRFGLARGFDVYDDGFEDGEAMKSFRSERRAGAVFDVFSPWLEGVRGDRFFAWLHFYDPHLPYDPPAPFDAAFRDKKYDGEIAYVDSVVGMVLGRLRDKDLLDGTLIVVAGDHGEALGEKREIDHGLFLYDGTLKVPLLLRSAGNLPAGVVVPTRVRLIDVLPTILDLQGISVPAGVRGTSLVPYARGREKADLPTYIETYYPRENFGWSELRGIVDGPWKYIRAPRPELYQLAKDPREERNLAASEASVLSDEARKLDGLIRSAATRTSPARRKMTATEEERLRSLGYLGAGRAPESPGEALPDPKDRIGDYLLYFRGNLLETEGRYDGAAECYKQVLASNPDVPGNHVNLASLYLKMNRTGDAIEVLERASAKFPRSEAVISRLTGLFMKAERWPEALTAGRALLAIAPDDFDGLFLTGSACARLGKWEEAMALYQKALAIEPENSFLRRRYAYSQMAAGRLEEALATYLKLRLEHPNDVAIALDLGRLHNLAGRRGEALAVLKSAAEEHASPEAFRAYALLLGKNGDFREAVSWIKRYLETSPAGETPEKTEARRLLGEWEKASKSL